MPLEQIEGRNPVIEALRRGRRKVHRIFLDEGAQMDAKLKDLMALAKVNGVPVERANRSFLKEKAKGRVHNGVIAMAQPLPQHTVQSLINSVYEHEQDPLLVLADEVVYEQNLGAILRSAMGAGAAGLVIPNRRGAGMSPVVNRVSMGGAEEVPVVRAGILSALKRIRKAGFRTVGADMGGIPYWEADLTGPLALVLGGESKGLSEPVQKRCDVLVSVPLAHGLESLNVSVTAGILLFERIRQINNESPPNTDPSDWPP
jgi:23S rRNA (guanosine2251-2'-O)-methyltransferase